MFRKIPCATVFLLASAVAASAHGAEPLLVQVASEAGCPPENWFREQLNARGVRGAVKVSLGAGGEGFVGEIEAEAPSGAKVTRRLSGVDCSTVADGLVVIANVHLSGLKGDPPPQAPAQTSVPSPHVAPASPSVAPSFFHVSLGLLGTVDSVVTGDASFGGGVIGWLSFGDRPFRGLALSWIYSRSDVTKGVRVTHEHFRLRLDAIPFDIVLTKAAALGFGLFLSGGALHVSADVQTSTPGARNFWLTGAGVRGRYNFGAVHVDVGVDATLALVQREFAVTGISEPLFSLPLFGVAATFSVGLPVLR